MNRKQNRMPSNAEFYRLCTWLEKQPKPIVMTSEQCSLAFHADTGIDIGQSTIRNACKTVGVELMRPSKKPIFPSNAKSLAKNRTRVLAMIVEELVGILDTAGISLSEKSKAVLRQIINNKNPDLKELRES